MNEEKIKNVDDKNIDNEKVLDTTSSQEVVNPALGANNPITAIKFS